MFGPIAREPRRQTVAAEYSLGERTDDWVSFAVLNCGIHCVLVLYFASPTHLHAYVFPRVETKIELEENSNDITGK